MSKQAGGNLEADSYLDRSCESSRGIASRRRFASLHAYLGAGIYPMSDENLQEWGEYDARMLEDSRVGRGTLPNQRSGRKFLQSLVDSPGNLEGPFLLSNAGEIAAEILNSSVGRGGVNRPDDIRLVQRLINSHLPVRLVPLSEDGICGPRTIFAIETYQKSILRMNPPDGRVDPGGPTFRSLTGGGTGPQPAVPSASAAASQTAGTPSVACPSNMREAAWGYLLQFTKKHEGAVFHMYNNRTADSTTQDVTCGVGFRLDPRGAATQSWVKAMFFDPTTNQTPSDEPAAGRLGCCGDFGTDRHQLAAVRFCVPHAHVPRARLQSNGADSARSKVARLAEKFPQ
jgi:hypothetical protein